MSFLGLFGKSKLDRQSDRAMQNIQSMQLDPTLNQSYEMSQGMANMGLDPASRQMAIQEANRGLTANLSRIRRVGGGQGQVNRLMSGMGDFGLGLAKQNADIMRQNRQFAIQSGMQYGQMATDLNKSKKEAEFNKISAEQNRRAQEASGLMSMFGAIGGGLASKSDYRLKENISLVGQSPEGINIYTFSYKGQDGVYQGVMAQELLGTKFNDSVIMEDDGMYAVKYSNIDVQFKQIN